MQRWRHCSDNGKRNIKSIEYRNKLWIRDYYYWSIWRDYYSAVATGTWTKINVNTEVYDTAGTYDNSSNYRWTPGVAGKYVIYGQVGFDSMSDHKYLYMALYKNGSQLWTDGTSLNQTSTSGTLGAATRGTWSIDLDADDYVELYGYHNNGNNRDASTGWCYFGGYKLIE
jgi:hypothetical protein